MKSSDSTVAQVIDSSFRDPSGSVFKKNGELFRQINTVYQDHYDHLLSSGLYEKLSSLGLIVPWSEIEFDRDQYPTAYKIVKPSPIPFISYPYEWCFSQLKDAALATLEIQRIALEHGMSLKDSSAYNIQFLNGKPVLIDTLSFEKLKPGKPWIAYRQFCQHFLGPLALMSYKDIRLGQLSRIYLDGVPVELASTLLPWRSWINGGIFIHIHLHALSEKRVSKAGIQKNILDKKVGERSLYGLIDHLRRTIYHLKVKSKNANWGNYYDSADPEYVNDKKQLVTKYLDRADPASVWDLGSNTGSFSRIASARGIPVISFDQDPECVEKNYLESKMKNEDHLLPLILDLNNPSPPIGWENLERSSLLERGPADMVLALALLHHLAIANNLSFKKIASFFRKICNRLIIEFIPKGDPNVKKLLYLREDIFSWYSKENFENEFDEYFKIISFSKVNNSNRYLYIMESKGV